MLNAFPHLAAIPVASLVKQLLRSCPGFTVFSYHRTVPTDAADRDFIVCILQVLSMFSISISRTVDVTDFDKNQLTNFSLMTHDPRTSLPKPRKHRCSVTFA